MGDGANRTLTGRVIYESIWLTSAKLQNNLQLCRATLTHALQRHAFFEDWGRGWEFIITFAAEYCYI